MTDQPKDPVLEATVERALAPYKDLLPPEALEEFRRDLREELARHPVSARLLKQVTPRAAPDASADVERADGAAEAASTKKGGKAESGGSR